MNTTCKTIQNSICIDTPVNSLKKKWSNLCLLHLNASIFSGSVLKQVWKSDVNCSKALSPVVAGITFKNLNGFSNNSIESTPLDSNCLGSRHLARFTVMDHNGLLSNNYLAVAASNFKICSLNSEISPSVTRSFPTFSVMVGSVGNPIFNFFWLKMLSFFVRLGSLKAVPEVDLSKASSFIKSCRFLAISISYNKFIIHCRLNTYEAFAWWLLAFRKFFAKTCYIFPCVDWLISNFCIFDLPCSTKRQRKGIWSSEWNIIIPSSWWVMQQSECHFQIFFLIPNQCSLHQFYKLRKKISISWLCSFFSLYLFRDAINF